MNCKYKYKIVYLCTTIRRICCLKTFHLTISPFEVELTKLRALCSKCAALSLFHDQFKAEMQQKTKKRTCLKMLFLRPVLFQANTQLMSYTREYKFHLRNPWKPGTQRELTVDRVVNTVSSPPLLLTSS